MNVLVQSCFYIGVSQNLGQRFDINPCFNAPRCKGVTKRVKIRFFDTALV